MDAKCAPARRPPRGTSRRTGTRPARRRRRGSLCQPRAAAAGPAHMAISSIACSYGARRLLGASATSTDAVHRLLASSAAWQRLAAAVEIRAGAARPPDWTQVMPVERVSTWLPDGCSKHPVRQGRGCARRCASWIIWPRLQATFSMQCSMQGHQQRQLVGGGPLAGFEDRDYPLPEKQGIERRLCHRIIMRRERVGPARRVPLIDEELGPISGHRGHRGRLDR